MVPFRAASRRRRVLAVLALTAAALVAWPGPGAPVRSEPAAGAPAIRFDDRTHDFGELQSDQQVEHEFTFRNAGDGPLTILGTRTSCGCTMTLTDEAPVAPGGTGSIRVTFDPAGQEGPVRKNLSVQSNDPGNGNVLLTIKAFVIPAEVPQVAEGDHPPITGQSLLMGDCASCHAEPARGKSGGELYAAVCATCHGDAGTGGRAPSLRHPSYLETRSDEDLRQGIAFGTANPRMPGYSELMGGPLSDTQIDSLVELLRRWGPTTEQGGDGADD